MGDQRQNTPSNAQSPAPAAGGDNEGMDRQRQLMLLARARRRRLAAEQQKAAAGAQPAAQQGAADPKSADKPSLPGMPEEKPEVDLEIDPDKRGSVGVSGDPAKLTDMKANAGWKLSGEHKAAGDTEHEDERAVEASAGFSKAAVEYKNKQQDQVGEGADKVKTNSEFSAGASVNYGSGVELEAKKKSGAAVGARQVSGTHAATGGYDWKEGNFDAGYEHTGSRPKADGAGASENKWNVGLGNKDGGEVKLGASHKSTQYKTDPKTGEPVVDGKGDPVVKSSTAVSGSGHVSREDAGADFGVVRTNDKGNAHSVSAGGDFNWETGSASGHVGYSMLTKGGSKVAVSVHAGHEVHADEPVAVGGQFEVKYVVTNSGGVNLGASRGPIGASYGETIEHFESGVRQFKTQDEAEKFQKHAAEELAEGEAPDPTSAAGALQIPVGESRGKGSTDAKNVGGSVQIEFGSVGAQHSTKDLDEVDVTRVDDKRFNVTITKAANKANDITADAKFLSDDKGSTEGHSVATTYQFDLSTEPGKAAFAKFSQDGQEPDRGAATFIRREVLKEEGEHDKIHIALNGDASWSSGTNEAHVQDQAGVHDKYTGHKEHDQDPSWIGRHVFGDDEQHSSMKIDSLMENQKEAGYRLTGTVSGDDGEYNRKTMGQMFDDQKPAGPVKASGDWTLSADVSKAMIHQIEKSSPAFQNAKTNEEKMQILSKLMADRGSAMAAGLTGSLSGNRLDWDLELKGDPNFPGRAGREKAERTVKELTAKLKSDPAAAEGVVATVESELGALEQRRGNVADESKYTDLPKGLRQEQLGVIEQEKEALESVRHSALAEAMKNKPGESAKDIAKREANPKGYDGFASGEARAIAPKRDEIAKQQLQISDLQGDINLAVRSLQKVEGGKFLNVKLERRILELQLNKYRQSWQEATGQLAELNAGVNGEIDDAKLDFMKDKYNAAAANRVIDLQARKIGKMQLLLMTLQQAAAYRKPATSDKLIDQDAEFWAPITSEAAGNYEVYDEDHDPDAT